MNVKFHSEIGTPLTMIEVMTRIQVILGKGLQSVRPLLKSKGRLDRLASAERLRFAVALELAAGQVWALPSQFNHL